MPGEQLPLFSQYDLPTRTKAQEVTRIAWAMLLKRVFLVDVTVCERCVEYLAKSRSAHAGSTPQKVRSVAESIARVLSAPDPMFVLDIAETEAGYRLVELNPFSGADLYACDLDAVVNAAAALLQR